MKRFKNILYFADGSAAPDYSLQRAVALATSNQASLTVVDVLDSLDSQRFSVDGVAEQTRTAMVERREEELAYMVSDYPDSLIYTRVLTGNPFVEVIKLVLNNHYDLLMKGVRPSSAFFKKVFGSTDMHLLRKCPCPVWIDKSQTPEPYHAILAAIDPETEASSACDGLVINLATSLAVREGAKLQLVHAWQVYGESLLSSARSHLSKAEFQLLLQTTRNRHEQALNQLLEPHGLSSLDPTVLLEHGHPAEVILRTEQQQHSDLIVMGTVGRSGIPGLIIGNTAEDVLSSTNASVLVVKPQGFECPVRPNG